MTDTIGTLAVRVVADDRQLAQQVAAGTAKAGNSALATARRFAGPLVAAFGLSKIAQGVSSVTGSASDLAESVNAVNVVYKKFGDEAPKEVQKLAEAAAKTRGLSQKDFQQMAVQFSSFTAQIAGKGGDVVGTLDDLTGRASDFASVMNLEVADAARIFQSGLAGETEPLKKFGINLSAAAVEAYAVEAGIAAAGESMTEQQKVQARYALLMRETADTQGDFANTSDQLANKQRINAANWENLRAKMGGVFLPIAEKVQAFIGDKLLPVIDKVSGFVSDKFLPALSGIGDILFRGDFTGGLTGLFGDQGFEDSALVAALFTVRDTAVQIVDRVRNDLLPAFSRFGDTIRRDVLPVVQTVGRWLADNKDVLLPFAAGVTAVVGAFLAFNKVITIIKGITAAFAAFNAVLLANPIGIVVAAIAALVGGLVVLYQKNERFRDIVQAVWEKIRTVVGGVVDWIRATAVPFIQQAWEKIAAAATWLWETVLQPVFRFIGSAWDTLLTGIKRLWNNVLKPVWETVAGVARWLWGVLSWVFTLWRTGWEILVGAVRMLWRTILQPVFQAVGDKIKDVWTRYVEPVLGWIGDRWDWLVKTVIRPVWQNLLKPVFDKLGEALDTTRRGFVIFKDAVADAWARIRDAAKAPIRFVIDTVINKGLIRTINNVAEFFTGKRPIKPVTMPRGLGGGGQRFGPGGAPAFGGIDFGAIGRFAKMLTDPAGALRDAVGGLFDRIADNPFVRMLTAVPGRLIGYAVDWIKTQLFGPGEQTGIAGRVLPRGQYTIGMPYLGYPGHYGADYPAATGTPVWSPYPGVVTRARALTGSYGRHVFVEHPGGIQTRYAHLSGISVREGMPVAAGQLLGQVGSTGNSTGPHLHFEYRRNGSPINPAGLGLFDKGGWLRHGAMALNLSGQSERVLNPEESKALRVLQLMPRTPRHTASRGDVNLYLPTTTERVTAEVAHGLRMRQQLAERT